MVKCRVSQTGRFHRFFLRSGQRIRWTLNGETANGWKLIDGALEKHWKFANFHETMAFVNAVAWIAHREDHHPDIALGYNRCSLRFNTHDVNGISVSDFFCAAAVDALHA